MGKSGLIVLDTHALIWWVDGNPHLSANAKSIIDTELAHEDGLVVVSSISAWEIALLVAKERLALALSTDEWLATVQDIDGVRFVPVDNRVAVQSTRLPGAFHADPADRMIVALARHLAAPLVTADTRMRRYKHVNTLW